jgi:hypothetical protein
MRRLSSESDRTRPVAMQADPVDGRGGRREMLCVVVRSDVKRADKRAEGNVRVEVEAGGNGLFGGESGRRCCFPVAVV